MKLMSLHRAWTIWTIALLAMWTLSGCGGNVSIPDTPDAAITEAEKKVKVAADAETAKSAKVGELWTDASSTYVTHIVGMHQFHKGIMMQTAIARIMTCRFQPTCR